MSIRKSLWIGAAVAAAIIIGTLLGGKVSAITYTAPDPDEYGDARDDVRLVLSSTPTSENITAITLPVYVTAPQNANPNSIRANVVINSYWYPYGDSHVLNNTRVWMTIGAPGAGYTRSCAVFRSQDGSSPITVRNFAWDDDVGLWYSNVKLEFVNRRTGGADGCRDASGRTQRANQHHDAEVLFRAHITGYNYTAANGVAVTGARTRSWIAYTTEGARDGYFATSARKRGANAATYSLQFATPCSIRSANGALGEITLYDLDSGNSDNGNRDINIFLYDETAGREIRHVQHITPTATSYSYQDSGSMTESSKQYHINMRFLPKHKYRLEIRNVYYYNVLMYDFPYNNISYVVGCPGGTIAPSLTTSLGSATSVRDGTNFTANFGINSTSRGATESRTAARVWYENDGNGVFNAGDTSVWTRDRNNPNWDRTAGQGDTWVHSNQPITVDASHGARICVSWQILSSPTPDITVNTTIRVTCFPIVRTPYAHIWGNDLRTGSGFGTQTNRSSGAWGTVDASGASWVEYAITAPNNVVSLASQTGARDGSAAPQTSWSGLTFSNVATPYGRFTPAASMGKIPDVAGAVAVARDRGVPINRTVTGNTTASALPGVIGGSPDMGNFDRSVAVTATGTITIDRDINYRSNALGNAGDIPQLILVADTINIAPGVRNIDAWLIARNTLNTCSGVPESARGTSCNTPLRINGAVMAGQLQLNRTYTNNSEAAEVMNLRGDAYIWAHRISQSGGTWQTVYTQEMPPRY